MAGYLAGDVDEWIYIDIDDQHPDSMRFIRDCEAAVGKEIRILRSKEYKCVEDRGDMNTEIFPECGIMCYLAQK